MPETVNEIDQMGGFVRTTLAELLLREGIDWPLHATWDELSIVATIHRGELVIPAFEARSLWWQPATEAHGVWVARHLGRVLWRWWRVYQGADASGRLYASLWRDESGELGLNRTMDGREVSVTLAPGCRFGEPNPAGRALVYRLGRSDGLKFEDALSQGWMTLD